MVEVIKAKRGWSEDLSFKRDGVTYWVHGRGQEPENMNIYDAFHIEDPTTLNATYFTYRKRLNDNPEEFFLIRSDIIDGDLPENEKLYLIYRLGATKGFMGFRALIHREIQGRKRWGALHFAAHLAEFCSVVEQAIHDKIMENDEW